MYILTDVLQKRLVIFIGLMSMSFGMWMVGTPESLGLKNDPVGIMLGMMIVGISAAIVAIPTVPEML